jgi:hypothetical protein
MHLIYLGAVPRQNLFTPRVTTIKPRVDRFQRSCGGTEKDPSIPIGNGDLAFQAAD